MDNSVLNSPNIIESQIHLTKVSPRQMQIQLAEKNLFSAETSSLEKRTLYLVQSKMSIGESEWDQ